MTYANVYTKRLERLAEFLSQQHAAEITLKLSKIEQIIDGDLPKTAFYSHSYWSTVSHPVRRKYRASAWLDNGYTASLSTLTESVTFRRAG